MLELSDADRSIVLENERYLGFKDQQSYSQRSTLTLVLWVCPVAQIQSGSGYLDILRTSGWAFAPTKW